MFFSCIRQRGGWNNNPSALQFRYAYRSLLLHADIKPAATGNVMPDLGGISTLPRQRAHSNEDDPEEAESPELAAANAVADHDYTSLGYGVSNFSSEIVQYIGGFIVRAVCKRISCTSCTEMLIEHKVTSILIFIRNNGGLIMPSPLVHHVLHTAEHIMRCNSGNKKGRMLTALFCRPFNSFVQGMQSRSNKQSTTGKILFTLSL